MPKSWSFGDGNFHNNKDNKLEKYRQDDLLNLLVMKASQGKQKL